MAAYWEITVQSAYDMFSKYKYLNVNLVFSHLGFWTGGFFLTSDFATFPDLIHCLLYLFREFDRARLGWLALDHMFAVCLRYHAFPPRCQSIYRG